MGVNVTDSPAHNVVGADGTKAISGNATLSATEFDIVWQFADVPETTTSNCPESAPETFTTESVAVLAPL